jgi:hypothetical protein
MLQSPAAAGGPQTDITFDVLLDGVLPAVQ